MWKSLSLCFCATVVPIYSRCQEADADHGRSWEWEDDHLSGQGSAHGPAAGMCVFCCVCACEVTFCKSCACNLIICKFYVQIVHLNQPRFLSTLCLLQLILYSIAGSEFASCACFDLHGQKHTRDERAIGAWGGPFGTHLIFLKAPLTFP
jgi:hypothetical protein